MIALIRMLTTNISTKHKAQRFTEKSFVLLVTGHDTGLTL